MNGKYDVKTYLRTMNWKIKKKNFFNTIKYSKDCKKKKNIFMDEESPTSR